MCVSQSRIERDARTSQGVRTWNDYNLHLTRNAFLGEKPSGSLAQVGATISCPSSKAHGESKRNSDSVHVAGPEAQEMYQTLVFPQPGEGEDDPRQDVNAILRTFQNYCNPRRNTVYERHRFWSHNQGEEERIGQCVIDLKTRAVACEFGEQRNLSIRDKMVFGIRDERVKERLLREPNLSLEKVLDLCRAAEATKQQVQTMTKEE